MKFNFTFKQMKTSKRLQQYAEEKALQRIDKFSDKDMTLNFSFGVDQKIFVVDCSLTGANGLAISVQKSSRNVYDSLDLVIEKIEILLRRRKERMNEIKRNLKEELTELYDMIGETILDEDDPEGIILDAEDVIKLEQARKGVS